MMSYYVNNFHIPIIVHMLVEPSSQGIAVYYIVVVLSVGFIFKG